MTVAATNTTDVFKRAPHLPFSQTATEDLSQNALVIRVQPDEGILLRFGSKVPGLGLDIDTPDDFAELIARGPRGATARFLEASGIVGRFAGAAARTNGPRARPPSPR